MSVAVVGKCKWRWGEGTGAGKARSDATLGSASGESSGDGHTRIDGTFGSGYAVVNGAGGGGDIDESNNGGIRTGGVTTSVFGAGGYP